MIIHHIRVPSSYRIYVRGRMGPAHRAAAPILKSMDLSARPHNGSQTRQVPIPFHFRYEETHDTPLKCRWYDVTDNECNQGQPCLWAVLMIIKMMGDEQQCRNQSLFNKIPSTLLPHSVGYRSPAHLFQQCGKMEQQKAPN